MIEKMGNAAIEKAEEEAKKIWWPWDRGRWNSSTCPRSRST